MTSSTSNAGLSSKVYESLEEGMTYTLPDHSSWRAVKFYSTPSGYQGAVFVNTATNVITVVNRGTEQLVMDGKADLAMGVAVLPSQFRDAETAYTYAKDLAVSLGQPVSAITITGHSLGGALTQMVAAKYAGDGIHAETFNAYGAGNLLSDLGVTATEFPNIVNHVMEHDPVSVLLGSKMIGSTFAYPAFRDSWLNGSVEGSVVRHWPNLYAVYAVQMHGVAQFADPFVSQQSGRPVTIDVPTAGALLRESLGFGPYFMGAGILRQVASLFATANALSPNAPAAPRRDPLSFDLDGDGIETIGIDTANPILFDHGGSGVRAATGWLLADDAFLALDRNGNGSIDSGRELFGDSTLLPDGSEAIDGFAALAAEDTNADGRVDAQDAHFASLRLWRDLDQDGISDAGELQTLTEAGIASIAVAKTENAVPLANGNQIADLGTYTRIDGSTGGIGDTATLADVDLASKPFFSEFTDHIALTPQAQALPDMQGSGLVRDLREAASLQTAAGQHLASVLTAYAAATTKAGQMALLPDLVEAWAATSTMGARTGAMGRRSRDVSGWNRTARAANDARWIDSASGIAA